MEEQNKEKFMTIVAQPQIVASGKIELDLDVLRNKFGNNFNTLQITNTDAASAIFIYADGVKIAYVTANNGIFYFDWEFGLKYNFISLENTNAGAVITAESVKVFVGRSGEIINGA